MTFLITLLAGLAGGAVSGVAGFVATLLMCQAMHVQDGDGAVGCAALSSGCLMGMAGMVSGIVLTLRRRHSLASVAAHSPLALGR